MRSESTTIGSGSGVSEIILSSAEGPQRWAPEVVASGVTPASTIEHLVAPSFERKIPSPEQEAKTRASLAKAAFDKSSPEQLQKLKFPVIEYGGGVVSDRYGASLAQQLLKAASDQGIPFAHAKISVPLSEALSIMRNVEEVAGIGEVHRVFRIEAGQYGRVRISAGPKLIKQGEAAFNKAKGGFENFCRAEGDVQISSYPSTRAVLAAINKPSDVLTAPFVEEAFGSAANADQVLWHFFNAAQENNSPLSHAGLTFKNDRKRLEWVTEYIAPFVKDPSRLQDIVHFGESGSVRLAPGFIVALSENSSDALIQAISQEEVALCRVLHEERLKKMTDSEARKYTPCILLNEVKEICLKIPAVKRWADRGEDHTVAALAKMTCLYIAEAITRGEVINGSRIFDLRNLGLDKAYIRYSLERDVKWPKRFFTHSNEIIDTSGWVSDSRAKLGRKFVSEFSSKLRDMGRLQGGLFAS